MEKPTGSTDTVATANTDKLPKNALNSDGWKGANQKHKPRRGDSINWQYLSSLVYALA